MGHSLAEEEVLFKPLTDEQPHLNETAQAIISGHRIIEDLLNNLTDATPQDLQWNNLLNHLEEVLKTDIHKEEEILIPAAEQLFS